MTEKERYRLEGMLRAKMPKTQIATQLGFSRQTIYNEIERGTYMHTVKWYDVPRYSAEKGQAVAEARQKNKGRPLKIGHDHEHEYAKLLDREMHDKKRAPPRRRWRRPGRRDLQRSSPWGQCTTT